MKGVGTNGKNSDAVVNRGVSHAPDGQTVTLATTQQSDNVVPGSPSTDTMSWVEVVRKGKKSKQTNSKRVNGKQSEIKLTLLT
jgi:hypothetical protein